MKKRDLIKGQWGDYELRNGKRFHGYEVYANGRIHMAPFKTDRLRDEADTISMLEKFFMAYHARITQAFVKHRREHWRDFNDELKLIDPSYDDSKYTYGIDDNGYVTKEPKLAATPEPPKETEPRP